MSVNINAMLGEAIIQACERAGFRVWFDEGSAQVRVRDRLAEAADDSRDERERAAAHAPRALPHQLSADLNNKRGSVLIALKARLAAARAADPVATEAVAPPPPPPVAKAPKMPGFGDDTGQPDDPVKTDLSPQVTAVISDTTDHLNSK